MTYGEDMDDVFICKGRMKMSRFLEMLEEVLEPPIVKLVETDAPEYLRNVSVNEI